MNMRPTRQLSAFDLVCHVIVFGAAIATVAFCVFALDRGFEITDEAYYVMLGMHPKAVTLYVSAQQWVMGPLWQISGTLASYRAAGLFILLVSSAILATGICSAVRQLKLPIKATDQFVVFAASAIGGLLYIATINLSPSYNLLASAGAYTAAGITLLSPALRSAVLRAMAFFLIGTSLCVVFVSKPSSGVAVFALLGIWMLILAPELRKGVVQIVATGALFALAVTGLALLQSTPSAIRDSLSNGLELFRMVQPESIGARLIRYALDFAGHTSQALYALWAVVGGVALCLAIRRTAALAILIAIVTVTFVHGRYFLGGAEQYTAQTGAAFVLILAALTAAAPVWARNGRLAAITIGLAALPYAVAFGTGNSLFTQAIVSMASWGGLLAVLAILNSADPQRHRLSFVLLAIFTTALASQIVSSGFRSPYHLAEPFSRQTIPTDIPGLGIVRVDQGTATFVENLKAAATACKIAPSLPFLGLYNLPGVAIVLQGVTVATPWLGNPAQAETAITFGPPDVLRTAVIATLLGPDGTPIALPPTLVAFPDGYKLCGEATYPFENQRIAIWRTKS